MTLSFHIWLRLQVRDNTLAYHRTIIWHQNPDFGLMRR
jgi:hypothetical protein